MEQRGREASDSEHGDPRGGRAPDPRGDGGGGRDLHLRGGEHCRDGQRHGLHTDRGHRGAETEANTTHEVTPIQLS